MKNELNKVLADWTRIGVAFNIRPAILTPDLETLLLRTAQSLPTDPHLLPAVVSWLVEYPLFVAGHRLAAITRQAPPPSGDTLAALGFLLETVRSITKTRHFDQTIRLCHPATPAHPLFVAQQQNSAWSKIARSEASAIARHWGLWCQSVELKDDVIRPASWIIACNPTFFDRAVLRGDLRLSVLASLQSDPAFGSSESSLAKSLGANRAAVRHALKALEQSCHIERITKGRCTAIRLIKPQQLTAA